MTNKSQKLMALTDVGKNAIKMYGVFGLRVNELRDGKFVQTLRIQKKNQITNQGRRTVLNLLCPSTYGAVQEELKIWSLAVGTNATPPTVADDDTTMVEAWHSDSFFGGGSCQVIDNPPNDFLLAISVTLQTTDANGSTLTEAGIYTRGDADDPVASLGKLLYARQVHSPIIKTAVMTIQYDWQLGITIQG